MAEDPTPVTRAEFDEFRAAVMTFLAEIRIRLLRLNKPYPNVTDPEPGDTVSRNGNQTFTVTVHSNKPGTPAFVRITKEEGSLTPAPGTSAVQVTWTNGNANPGTAVIAFPKEQGGPFINDEFLVVVSTLQDPTQPNQHVDKVPITTAP